MIGADSAYGKHLIHDMLFCARRSTDEIEKGQFRDELDQDNVKRDEKANPGLAAATTIQLHGSKRGKIVDP